MRYSAKWPVYAQQWDAMAIKSARAHEFEVLARFAIEHRQTYESISSATGVPWAMIAALHRRESDADFTTYLGNGEPLNRVTRLVPKGRGPFPTFEAGAIDALKLDGLASVPDWRLEKILYFCEIFNGTGYNNRGLPSPYLWGGTNIQKPGKYVADGKWNGRAWDTQPGCAPIIATIAKLDPSITFVRET
jgi:lysozyme family protein